MIDITGETHKDSYGDRDWSIGVTGGDRDIDGLLRLIQEGEAGRLGIGGEGSISLDASFTTSSVSRLTVPSWSSLPQTSQAQPEKSLKGGSSSKVGSLRPVVLAIVSLVLVLVVEIGECAPELEGER